MKAKGLFASLAVTAALTVGIVTASLAADQQRSCCSYMAENSCKAVSSSQQAVDADKWENNKGLIGWASTWRTR